MTFTGNLIEGLMATVERAERRTATAIELPQVERIFADSARGESILAESSLVEASLIEPWFASAQENADYDSKFIGVA
jgi:hypothetical protein